MIQSKCFVVDHFLNKKKKIVFIDETNQKPITNESIDYVDIIC